MNAILIEFVPFALGVLFLFLCLFVAPYMATNEWLNRDNLDDLDDLELDEEVMDKLRRELVNKLHKEENL